MNDDERAKLRAAFAAYRTLESNDKMQKRIASDAAERFQRAQGELWKRMVDLGVTSFVMDDCLVRLARMSPAEQPRVVVQPVEVLS